MKILFTLLTLFIFSFNVVAVESKSASSKTSATQLEDLIRGEMAAVKTYDQVINKLENDKERNKMSAIRQDHQLAVEKLKKHAAADVKADTESAGAWGSFASGWTGGASIFGNKTALKALSQGEEHGVNEYKEALKDENINPKVKQIIKTELLPKTKQHIKTIKSYM